MKILHYIDKFTPEDLVSDKVKRLLDAETLIAEVKVVKQWADFQKVLEGQKPDIVHLHGCWKGEAYKCAKYASKKGFATVLSTHWGLNSYARANEQHVKKLFKAIAYQYRLVKLVDAIVLDDEKEKQAIVKLDWKKRIDIVPSSLLDSQVAPEQEANEMLGFYTKVLSTRYQYSMSSVEVQAIPSLMYAGLSQSSQHNLIPSDQLVALRELNPEQWRRIFLYADDEGIRDIVEHGIQLLQLNAPTIDTKAINRFPLMKLKNTQDLANDEDKVVEKYKEDRLSDKADDIPEVMQNIIALLHAAKLKCNKGTFSLHHLAELYSAIKFNDYNEDKFKTHLKHLRLHKFTRRIIQLLNEYVHLEEGFMPVTPLDDKACNKLRHLFDKRK